MPNAVERWIFDASPLIVLAKARRLALVEDARIERLVPAAVAREIVTGPPGDPARMAIEQGWGNPVPDETIPESVLGWSLGPGESAAIAAALARAGSVAVLDDAEGRRCAQTHGVLVTGSIGIVLRAKRLGHIEQAATVLRELRAAGLYLDDRTIRSALQRVVGEAWEP
jgi:predicted nucleic acid-binding protein